MRKYLASLVILVVLAGLALLAFLKTSGGPTNTVPQEQHAAAAETPPVYLPDDYKPEVTTANRRYKLGVLFPFLAAPFWVNEAYGIIDQAKLDGADVVWLSADGYDNIEAQNSQMENLITLKVDAILLAATSFNGTAPAVERAIAAGIPVLTHVTSSNSSKLAATVLADNTSIGRKQGEYLCKALGGRGTIAMLNGPAAADWSSDRVRGFKAELAAACPNVTVVTEKFGIPDRADAQRLASDILAAFPQLNGFFTVADGMGLGVTDAGKSVSRSGRLLITTASFSRETLPYVRSGAISVNVDESPVVTGRVVVNRAVALLNGEPIPKSTYVPIPAWLRDNVSGVPNDHWAPDGWRIQ